MNSERQRAANRANAKKSTGPKSRAGKERVSRNAYRHGLSVPPTADLAWAARVEKLASEIVSSMKGALDDEQARQYAEAHLEVERAHSAFAAVSAKAFVHVADGEQPTAPATDCEVAPAASAVAALKKLDRYVRRAGARRDRIVKSFVAQE